MSYINRKMRLFKRVNGSQLEPRRSEARLKTYQSAIDVRAWCGVVDDRRRHILELVTKSKEKARNFYFTFLILCFIKSVFFSA